MNVRKWAGIVVLISLLTVAGKLQADDLRQDRIEQLHNAEAQLGMLSQTLGQNNPEVIVQRGRVDMLRQQIMSEVDARRDQTRREFDDVNQRLHDVQDELRRVTGRTDVSLDSLDEVVQSLDKERESLLLESAVADARREAIEDAINREAKRAQSVTEIDAASREIQNEIDALQQRLQYMQEAWKKGLSTQADVTAAQAALAEAQTKLAERRNAVVADSGGAMLAELNHELVDSQIAATERKAKAEFIRQRLIEMSNALRIADEKNLSSLLRQRAAAEIEADTAAHDWRVVHDEISPAPTSQPAQ